MPKNPIVDRASVEQAARCIAEDFSWIDTPQGDAYWLQVYQNLQGLLDDHKPGLVIPGWDLE